ncbi:hypothetical protein MAV100_26690 [Mycobacterium avium subsp. hominissuis 100]|nr:hypothetical protein MAV100_26690 [Mycobacterium avium subsp. hominissuis 100]
MAGVVAVGCLAPAAVCGNRAQVVAVAEVVDFDVRQPVLPVQPDELVQRHTLTPPAIEPA